MAQSLLQSCDIYNTIQIQKLSWYAAYYYKKLSLAERPRCRVG